MDYKLSKRLKESGFPNNYGHPCAGCLCNDAEPTLSELINACGGNNKALMGGSDGKWAYAIDGKLGQEGSTPEEAVALLFLALKEGKE